MELWEAVKLLKEGKKVRRRTWAKNEYIYLDNHIIKDEKGKIITSSSILFGAPNGSWEEYKEEYNEGWQNIEEHTRTVLQVRCPHCFTYSCREISDIHFIYCPHCGAKVVK